MEEYTITTITCCSKLVLSEKSTQLRLLEEGHAYLPTCLCPLYRLTPDKELFLRGLSQGIFDLLNKSSMQSKMYTHEFIGMPKF